jgi:hypothetical protein
MFVRIELIIFLEIIAFQRLRTNIYRVQKYKQFTSTVFRLKTHLAAYEA